MNSLHTRYARWTLVGFIIGIAAISVNVAASPSLFSQHLVYADEYDELAEEKEEKLEEKNELEEEAAEAAIEEQTYTEQLTSYRTALNATQNNLTAKLALIAEIDRDKEAKEELFETKMLEKGVLMRGLYKQSDVTPLELFVGSESFASFAQSWQYYRTMVGEGRRQVLEVSHFIDELSKTLVEEEERRVQLEKEAAALAAQQAYYNAQLANVQSYLSDINSQISSLESDIADITAKQEELIREKLSATAASLTVGEYETAVESLPEPGFSPAFAAFSYGRPHRVAMSQYGAYGRAKAGQDYEDILKAYYHDIEIVEYDVPDEITVTGNFNGTIDFEGRYLKGIAEMPSSWADKGGYEALKAQAIAARTYALSYTNNAQGAICDTQSCQVFLESKADADSAARWHDAVEDTRGLVMVHGGAPIRAWYASTHGGYSRLPTDFDVKWNSTPSYIKRIVDGDGDGNAYEGPEYGNSPWYHKAWYSSSDGHPWLTEEEMLDLLNAALLPSSYNEHLSHPDDDGWSPEEVRDALADEGISPLESIDGIAASFSGEGYTATLVVSGREIDAQRFRKVFVLRSRGNLALWSSLFDIVER